MTFINNQAVNRQTTPNLTCDSVAAPSPVLPRVSVVIPTYNRGAILAHTLKMVLQQDFDNYEIIVVDQSPQCSPEVENIIRAAGGKIRYLRLQTPNLPAARNAGVRASTGDIIVFIDDDVEIPPDYLKNHARHYDDNEVGGVAGMTFSPRVTSTQESIQRTLKGYGATRVFPDGTAHLSWIAGGNGSYRKSLILAAGMSDERFAGTAWAEDVDLAVRVRHLGCILLFDPEIRLLHLEASGGGCENRISSERNDKQRIRLTVYYLLKNRKIVGTIPVLCSMALTYRRYILTRATLRAGPVAVVRGTSLFVQSVRRALSCLGNLDLPLLE